METLRITDEGSIRIIELHRPDSLNALNGQMIDDLTDAFRDAGTQESVKVAVLTGAGKAFWAGADLKEMGGGNRKSKHTLTDMFDTFIDFPKPLLVAVNGVGVGVGATICGLADFVFMADTARLRTPFSALGLTAEAASTVTFPRLMGHQRASWFLLAAEWMDAEQCVDAGLALQATPNEELMPTVLERAATLAALPSASLQMTKSLVRGSLSEQLKAAVRAENAGLAQLGGGPANQEALAAFREKREADFTGL